jgi:hypothetical protein
MLSNGTTVEILPLISIGHAFLSDLSAAHHYAVIQWLISDVLCAVDRCQVPTSCTKHNRIVNCSSMIFVIHGNTINRTNYCG